MFLREQEKRGYRWLHGAVLDQVLVKEISGGQTWGEEAGTAVPV